MDRTQPAGYAEQEQAYADAMAGRIEAHQASGGSAQDFVEFAQGQYQQAMGNAAGGTEQPS